MTRTSRQSAGASYWPNGQLKTRLDQRGITTTYIYDPANRLTDRTYSDGTADHFVLDDAGRITSATASRSGVVVARQYFPTGLIKEEQTTWPAGISGTSTTTLVGFAYDSANRETTLTLPDGRTIDRTFTNRNELRSLAIGGQSIATLGYDNGGRRTSTAFANGLTDTRTYTANNLLESTTVAAGAAPPVVALSYSYDANRRKLAETDVRDATRTQNFGYDFNDRLTSWSTGATPRLPTAQTWELSPVGDWSKNTVDGVTETRTHTAVHEIKTSNGLPLGYDAAGNLTRTAEDQRFTWDAENRLLAAEVGSNPDQAYGVAQYSFDAFGRRVAKRVFGTTTLFVHAGNWQVVQEIDAPTVASPADKASDGDLATLGIVPDGAILWPTWDAEGNRLDPIRVNMQPESTEIPDGFLADKGRDLDLRTNGLTYGWSAPEGSPMRPEAQTRHFMPMPQYDTLSHLSTAGQQWKIALPNGSYPVVVVCGDPTSLAHTNNITINGAVQVDPDPGNDTTVPAYEQGDFDGYAVQVEVTDGFLTITAGAGAFDPTLCFLEIGAEGTELTQDIKDWLADQVDAATKRTGGSPFWNGGREETRSYVWGSGIDELVGYQRSTVAAGTQTYFAHAGAQWSVQAVTNESGQVVERYSYGASGKRVVDGVTNGGRSSIGLTTGWTGRAHDEATGTIYFRNREWQPDYQFLNRDPLTYVDGYSLYRGYFLPGGTDPYGLFCGKWIIRVKLSIPVAEEQQIAAGGPTIDGFEVEFDPTGCPGFAGAKPPAAQKLKIVQTIKGSGGTGAFSHVDTSKRATGILPPGYTETGRKGEHGPWSYIDAPINPRKWGGETTFTINACAILEDAPFSGAGCGAENLGCVNFTFGDVTRTFDVPGSKALPAPAVGVSIGSAAPQSTWEKALKDWKENGGFLWTLR